MTRNKFTSEEDNLIVDRIRKNPYNLKARFEEIADELGTHSAVSVQRRYYKQLKTVCFVSIGTDSHLVNRKITRGGAKATKTSPVPNKEAKWKRIIRIIFNLD
mgnify:FL=1|jgi:hypothetical protein